MAVVHLLILSVSASCIQESWGWQPVLNTWYGCIGNDTYYTGASTVTQILCDGPWRYFNATPGDHDCSSMTFSLVDIIPAVDGVSVQINPDNGQVFMTIDLSKDYSAVTELWRGKIKGYATAYGQTFLTASQSVWKWDKTSHCECMDHFENQYCSSYIRPASQYWRWSYELPLIQGRGTYAVTTKPDCGCTISPSGYSESTYQSWTLNGLQPWYDLGPDFVVSGTHKNKTYPTGVNCAFQYYAVYPDNNWRIPDFTLPKLDVTCLSTLGKIICTPMNSEKEYNTITPSFFNNYIKVFASNGQWMYFSYSSDTTIQINYEFYKVGCYILETVPTLTTITYINPNDHVFSLLGNQYTTSDAALCTVIALELYYTVQDAESGAWEPISTTPQVGWTVHQNSSGVYATSTLPEMKQDVPPETVFDVVIKIKASNGVYWYSQGWKLQRFQLELVPCSVIHQPMLLTQMFQLDGVVYPTFQAYSGSLALIVDPLHCFIDGYELYDAKDAPVTVSKWNITYTATEITINSEKNYEEVLPRNQTLFLKIRINNFRTYWLQDSITGLDQFDLHLYSCFIQIVYPPDFLKPSYRVVTDYETPISWTLGQFTTSNGSTCPIDKVEVYDGSDSTAAKLSDWSVSYINQIVWVQLPDYEIHSAGYHDFYLKITSQGTALYTNVKDVIKSSLHDYFEIQVVLPGSGDPVFSEQLDGSLDLIISNGQLLQSSEKHFLPSITDPDDSLIIVIIDDNCIDPEIQFSWEYNTGRLVINSKGRDMSELIKRQPVINLNITLLSIQGSNQTYNLDLNLIDELSLRQQIEERQVVFVKEEVDITQNEFDDLRKLYIDRAEDEKLKQIPPLTAYIKSFDQNGEMKIMFSKLIQTQGINITTIDNSTLNLTLIKPADFQGNSSNFTWKTQSLSPSTLTLLVTFEDPLAISPGLTYQKMQVDFLIDKLDTFKTVEVANQTVHPDYWTLFTRVPRQQPQTSLTETLNAQMRFMGRLSNFLMILSIFIYFFVVGERAIRHMQRFVRALQMTIHLGFMSIPYPPNIMYLFQMLLPVVGFDFLDSFLDWQDQNIIPLDFKRQDSIEANIQDQHKDLGYETHLSLPTLNSLGVFISIQLIGVGVMFLTFLIRICFQTNLYLFSVQDYLRKSLIFAGVIGLILDAFFEFLISGILDYMNHYEEPFGEYLAHILASYGLLMTMVITPLVLIVMLFLKIEHLENDRVQETFGFLYLDVKYKELWCRAYYLLFVIRRIAIIFYCKFQAVPEVPLIYQILFVMFLNLSSLIYFGLTLPFKIRHENLFGLFHEFMICIIMHQSLLFTDFTAVLETEQRYDLTYFHLGLTVFWCLFDIFVTLVLASLSLRLFFIKYGKLFKAKFKAFQNYLRKLYGIRSHPEPSQESENSNQSQPTIERPQQAIETISPPPPPKSSDQRPNSRLRKEIIKKIVKHQQDSQATNDRVGHSTEKLQIEKYNYHNQVGQQNKFIKEKARLEKLIASGNAHLQMQEASKKSNKMEFKKFGALHSAQKQSARRAHGSSKLYLNPERQSERRNREEYQGAEDRRQATSKPATAGRGPAAPAAYQGPLVTSSVPALNYQNRSKPEQMKLFASATSRTLDPQNSQGHRTTQKLSQIKKQKNSSIDIIDIELAKVLNKNLPPNITLEKQTKQTGKKRPQNQIKNISHELSVIQEDQENQTEKQYDDRK